MKEKKHKYTLTLTPSIIEKYRIISDDKGLSLSTAIDQLIREYLKKNV